MEVGDTISHFNLITLYMIGGVTRHMLSSLHCRRILGGRNFVRVRNVVVAAIFDLTTVEDWGE